ncbi:VIT family protein [Candidatus Saccharibacteria bacterium]|nr:VIT family protein [Candidatus Saccharibacteria bacterium]MBP7834559.1 VIT family protein [Candidatus Saccharibacteria bacterium]
MNDTEYLSPNFDPNYKRSGAKLNWLRAAVLGANDGIVSIAGLVVGVAGATDSRNIIVTAGVAGIVAGAISMAAGEYVSVSSQRDTERAYIEKERLELQNDPDGELLELASIYQAKGLKKETALTVAKELTERDAFAAHLDAELAIDPNDLTNPWHAAIASALAFLSGAIIPLLAITLPPSSVRVPITFASVILALAITGIISAQVGGANKAKATLRVVIGGALAMLVTYEIGQLFNINGI